MQQQNSDEIVREKLVELLARLPRDTPESRQKLYGQLRALFERRHPQHKAILETAIAGIEPGNSIETEKSMPGEQQTPKRKRSFVIPGVIAAAVAAAGAGWYALQPRGNIRDFDEGITGYTANVATLAQIPANWPKIAVSKIDGDTAIEVKGTASLFAIEAIPVDPGKRYSVKARIRVVKDDPSIGGAAFHIGVATFDAEGKLQTDAPGAHRYAAALGRLLKTEEGWVDITGEITGTGNKSHTQFRKGTTTVRPVALLNFRSPRAVAMITSLSVEEVQP